MPVIWGGSLVEVASCQAQESLHKGAKNASESLELRNDEASTP